MNKKILIVDDDMINRKLVNVHIKKFGYSTIEAENGMEALNILKKENDIDMVFLDIFMPVMNGLDLLKILKEDNVLKNIPIAILTTDDSKKNESLQLGACEVLIKPIKEAQIKDLLSKCLI